MKLLKRLQSFTKRNSTHWLMSIIVLGMVVIIAIWLGRGVSIKTKDVNISVLPDAHPAPRAETFGPGSPIVSGEKGDAQSTVALKSPHQQEKQQSDAGFVTHGAGSPVVIGKDAHATAIVNEK